MYGGVWDNGSMRGVFCQDSYRNVTEYYSARVGSTNNSLIVSLENLLQHEHRRDRTHRKIDQQQVRTLHRDNSLHDTSYPR